MKKFFIAIMLALISVPAFSQDRLVVLSKDSGKAASKVENLNTQLEALKRELVTATNELIAPEKPVDVYKLVKIKSDIVGDLYDLTVMTIQNGKIVFVETIATSTPGEWVFTGPPSEYVIKLTVFSKDGTSDVTTGKVVIGNVPNPSPTPNPNPNPLPNPVTEKYGFTTLSRDVVTNQVPAEYKQYASKLADNFDSVASAIAAGAYKTPNEANKELTGRNRFTLNNDATLINAWMPFFKAWADKADELNKSEKLPATVQAYAEVFIETKKGLLLVK